MLEYLRAASQGFAGRAIMTVVLGLIVFSFALWGTGDAFRGYGSNKVASVGGAAITPEEFRFAYQNALQQYQRRLKAPITNAQAHAMGLDVQTLGRLIADTALNERARALGLAVSDDELVKAIREAPGLKDGRGGFDRDRFDQALRDSGLSERGFFAEQRKATLRQQIGVSLAANLTAPKALVEALAKFSGQSRAIDYVILPAGAAGDIPAPTQEQLQAFFNERKANYRAPEYRAINILAVTPSTLAKPDEVSEADARALYDRVKDQRFGVPEKRDLEQIVFANDGEAADALAKIKAGATFDDIVKARGLTEKDISLGELQKSQIFDKSVADAAFALPAGGVSDVVKGQFGSAIVRVTKISPSSVKPFEEAAADLRNEIALDRAANDALTIHDKIEDARASGKTLEEAAKTVGLGARQISGVDAAGLDKSGAAVADLAEKEALLRAVFASDVGVDDQPVSTRDRGFVWFEVSKIEPSRERSLDEVKDKVEQQWREEETAKALAAKAAEMTGKLDGGATLSSLAEADKLEVKSAADIHRNGGAGLSENAVTAIFNAAPNGAGSAAVGDARMVFKVTSESTPPIDYSSPEIKQLQARLDEGFGDDLMGQYIVALEAELGVSVNEAVLQAAIGG
jgi:peptidyl-prolyl cis-trans isomerase D